MPEMTPEGQANQEPASFEEAKKQLLERMSGDPANCELYSSISCNVHGVALVFAGTINDEINLKDELLKIHVPHCGLVH